MSVDFMLGVNFGYKNSKKYPKTIPTPKKLFAKPKKTAIGYYHGAPYGIKAHTPQKDRDKRTHSIFSENCPHIHHF